MSWSKVKIEVGKTGANDAMAASLTDIGVISDKSTSLSAEDGESLTATATGGIVVAEEEGEPVISITTRVKEMTYAVETLFTGAVAASDDLTVKTGENESDELQTVVIEKDEVHLSYTLELYEKTPADASEEYDPDVIDRITIDLSDLSF